MAVLDRMNRHARTADGSYVSSMASDPDLVRAAEDGTLIGTPAENVERLTALRAGGVEYVLLSGLLGDPTQFRIFAEEVMPAFAADDGQSDRRAAP